jgi:hypothetical protein
MSHLNNLCVILNKINVVGKTLNIKNLEIKEHILLLIRKIISFFVIMACMALCYHRKLKLLIWSKKKRKI